MSDEKIKTNPDVTLAASQQGRYLVEPFWPFKILVYSVGFKSLNGNAGCGFDSRLSPLLQKVNLCGRSKRMTRQNGGIVCLTTTS